MTYCAHWGFTSDRRFTKSNGLEPKMQSTTTATMTARTAAAAAAARVHNVINDR